MWDDGPSVIRLRTPLLATAGCAVVLAFWTTYLSPYRVQHRASAALTELGATVTTEPVGPTWLRKLVGDEYLVIVTEVLHTSGDITDSGLEHIGVLKNLETAGITLFLIAACFQFSNNLGVLYAIEPFLTRIICIPVQLRTNEEQVIHPRRQDRFPC